MFLVIEAIENNKETIIIFILALVVIIGVYLVFFAPKKREKGETDQVIKNTDEKELQADVMEEPFTTSPEDLSSNQDTPVVGTDFQNLNSAEDQTLVQEKIHDEMEEVEPVDPDLKKTLVEENSENEESEVNPYSAPDNSVEPEDKDDLDETPSEDEETVSEAKDENSEIEDKNENEEVEEKPELGKYHVLYRKEDSKWYVKREGSEKVLRVLETQQEAIAWATIKALNQDTTIVIHKRDGKIRKQNY